MDKKSTQYSEKDKATPAYRKKLEEENSQLKKSLASTQNQASILQQNNAELTNTNMVNSERMKGIGLSSLINNFAFLIAGAGISYGVEKNYLVAWILIVIAFILAVLANHTQNIISILISIYRFIVPNKD